MKKYLLILIFSIGLAAISGSLFPNKSVYFYGKYSSYDPVSKSTKEKIKNGGIVKSDFNFQMGAAVFGIVMCLGGGMVLVLERKESSKRSNEIDDSSEKQRELKAIVQRAILKEELKRIRKSKKA